MPDRFIETHIRQLPLFANLPPEMLLLVTETFRVMRVERGEVIFAQGEPTRGMYMFVNGRGVLVRIDAQGNEQQLGVIGPRQFLNEAALFKSGIEAASLHVVERATVLFATRQQLMDVVSHNPELKRYLPFPKDVAQTHRSEKVFSGQRENEEVILNLRRHWWAFGRRLVLPGGIALLIVVLDAMISIPWLFMVILVLAFVIFGTAAVYFYLEWRNDHVIITSQRVVRIERTIHTMRTNISEIPLASIHEVNADIVTSDPLSRIFNYGTVQLKTAGDSGNMTLPLVPDPDRVQDIILENRMKRQENQGREHRNVIRATVDKALSGQNITSKTGGDTQTTAVVGQSRSFLATEFIDADGNLVYRKHSTLWIRSAILPLMMLFFSALLFLISIGTSLGGPIGPLGAFLLFLIGGLWFYWADWDWRNDMYIIGNDIIRIIHRRPLWLQNEDEQIILESVDNVMSDRSGLLQSMLNYGDVKISLIGSDLPDAKVFHAVPNPQAVQAEITRRQMRVKNREKEEAENRHREEMAEYISVYHESVSGGAHAEGYVPPSAQSAPPPPNRPVQDRRRPPSVPRQRGDE